MRNKLLCLIMAILMIFPLALSSCSTTGSDKDGDETKQSTSTSSAGGTKARTICLYGITGDDTTEAGIKAAQDAINLYSEGTFYARIILKLYPEDEYYSILESKLAQLQKNVDDGISSKYDGSQETTAAEEEDSSNSEKYGNTIIYPDEQDPQVDIFMVRGKDKLEEYYEDEYLVDMNSYLEVSYKLIKKYITSANLGTGQISGAQVGIPNNHVMGEYTYLLLNKEIVDNLYFSPSEVASSTDKLIEYLSDAKKYYGNYVTLYNYPTDMSVHITDEFSLIGGMLYEGVYENTLLTPTNLLADSDYVSYLKLLNNLNRNNYVVEGDKYELPENRNVAAAYIKGGYGIEEQYSDEYYVQAVANPIASSDEYPGTYLCVSPYTTDVDRCVQLIEALTTDKNFRNLLQYGAENTHYTVDYNGIYNIIDDPEYTYSMDPADTGNMFIMAQNSEMSDMMLDLSANDWENAKQQNLYTIKSPYTFFNMSYITEENYWKLSEYWTYTDTEEFNKLAGIDLDLDDEIDTEAKRQAARELDPFFDYPCYYTEEIIDNVCKQSQTIYNSIINYTGNDVEAYIKTMAAEFESSTYYKAFTASETGTIEGSTKLGPNADSPVAQYSRYFDIMSGIR